MKHLFLASTTFNVIIAASIAYALKKSDPSTATRLILIDQKKIMDISAISSSAIFDHIDTMPQAIGNKKLYRQQTFNLLGNIIAAFPACHLYTGNDRRIEFQFCYHLLNKIQKVTGHYYDDGLYSYTGFNKNTIVDFTEFFLKRLSMGRWVNRPVSPGTGDYIDTTHLMFPLLALPALQSIQQQPLQINDVLAVLSQLERQDITLSGYDYIILMPHSSVATIELVNHVKQLCLNNETSVLIKPHPRDNKEYWPAILGEQVRYFFDNVSFEIFLNQLNSGTVLLSGASSTLMTTRWLKPDIHVLCGEKFDSGNTTHVFFKKLGIQFLSHGAPTKNKVI